MTLAGTASLLRRTALYDLHRELGAKMVPFAGYEMPVQYPAGILGEHLHTRSQAGLFDVSHMGQIRLSGAHCVSALERLVPGDLAALASMRMRYTLLLNEAGGILDDLMATRLADGFFVVVNAARKEFDLAHLQDRLGAGTTVEPLMDRAGTRFDVLATVAATASFRLGADLSIGLELVGGVTSSAYQHEIDGVPVWERSAARAQAGLRLEWRQ